MTLHEPLERIDLMSNIIKDKVEEYDEIGARYFNKCDKYKNQKNHYADETDWKGRIREYNHKFVGIKNGSIYRPIDQVT